MKDEGGERKSRSGKAKSAARAGKSLAKAGKRGPVRDADTWEKIDERTFRYSDAYTSYRAGLPFEINQMPGSIPMPIDHPELDHDAIRWSDEACRVAEQALEQGFALSVPIAACHAPQR